MFAKVIFIIIIAYGNIHLNELLNLNSNVPQFISYMDLKCPTCWPKESSDILFVFVHKPITSGFGLKHEEIRVISVVQNVKKTL